MEKFKKLPIEGYLGLVILFMIIFFSINSDQFFTLRNLLDLAEGYAVSGIFALGVFVVLVTGGIDVSFAAIASVVQYIIATLSFHGFIQGPIVGIFLAMAIGISFGLINATLIYYLNVISIIITISVQAILFGGLMWLTSGKNIYDLPDWWVNQRELISFHLGGTDYQIGLPFLLILLLAGVTWLFLARTTLGRQLYAVGGAQESALRVGIRVGVIHLFAYGYMGALSAIAGLVQVYRMGEVVPNALVGGELDVLAATVLGGVSLMGGRGSVIGTLMGVFLIGILKNGLNLIGVSSYSTNIVIGIVIVIAITITHYKKRNEINVGFA